MAFGVFKKLVSGLTRTRENLAQTLSGVLRARQIDEQALEELETSLLAADLGPEVCQQVLRAVRARAARATLDAASLRETVREVLRAELPARDAAAAVAAGTPRVVFVVGVNGGGKTTTVGKLAARARAAGQKVLVVAADTFRAAAVEQLEQWVHRAGAELIRQRDGADPAAVVFDALRAAVARRVDLVLVDTAGRLHTKTNLMTELGKLARVAGREVAGAPHEVLLVLDATTGQNALAQADEFTRAMALTGIVLTKLDGTAKGGVALAIQRRLGLPIRYVGVGEAVDDLLEFDPEAYLAGLLGSDA